MLVDLGRNDVGRVAQTGTCSVTEQMVIERYSHVMHIVSNVEGKLKPGLDAHRRAARDVSRPARSAARRRCARWRSSTSSSRSSAASTPARSATSASTATWTSRSRSAPRWSRTACSTCRPARGIVADSVPDGRMAGDAEQGARRCCARRRWPQAGLDSRFDWRRAMLLMIDNYDSFTYNLVQYFGELGAGRAGRIATTRSRSTRSPRWHPARIVISPGPVHAERGRHLGAADPALRRQDADPRRVPRPPGDRPGVRRQDRARAAA